jgi:hypothetical protein
MNRLPSVLRKEIWEYVRGDRTFAQTRDTDNPARYLFEWAEFVLVNQVYDCFRDVDEKGQSVFRPKFHPPSMERFSWAPLIPSYFRSSQNTAMTVRPVKRKAEIQMTQLDISSFMVKK